MSWLPDKKSATIMNMSDQQNTSENQQVDILQFLKASKEGLIRRLENAKQQNSDALKAADSARDEALQLKGAVDQMDKLIAGLEPKKEKTT